MAVCIQLNSCAPDTCEPCARVNRAEDQPRQFVAYVTASAGSVLVGGEKHHESIQFESQEDASRWIISILESNGAAGRSVSAWGVNTVGGAP